MTGFRIVRSTRVTEAGFLGVERVEIADSDDARHARHVVRHPGAVVVVPVVADRSGALLVRQFRAAVGRDLLEIPAGKRDVDGELPEATAARELEEEVGHSPGRLVKLAEFFNSPGFCDEYTHLFAALDLEDVGAPTPQGAEERAMTIERVAFVDVDARIASSDLVDAKSIIGLLLARELLAREQLGRDPFP